MIRLVNASKNYSSKRQIVPALKNISTELPDTGFVCILGKSGCGKSTLLNILGTLDTVSSGKYTLNDIHIDEFSEKELNALRRDYFGFIFQDYNLINSLTVFENIRLSLNKEDFKNSIEIVSKNLALVGLSGYETRYPYQLSGGEQQRISIARALSKNPKVILADEPTGNLDSETGDSIFEVLKKLSKDRLVIAVTHDVDSCMRFGDRVIKLKDGSIYEDEIINSTNQSNNQDEKENIEHKIDMPFKSILKIAWSNLSNKWLRSFLSLFVLLLSLAVTVGMLNTFLYTTEKGIYRTVSNNNTEYLYFYETEYNRYMDITKTHELINRDSLEYLLESSVYNSIINLETELSFTGGTGTAYKLNSLSIIESEDDMSDMGLELYPGYQEISDNDVIISDLSIEYMCYSTKAFFENELEIDYLYFIYLDGKEIPLDLSVYDYEYVIGKEIRKYDIRDFLRETGEYTSFIISGIYKTDYQTVFNSMFTYRDDIDEDTLTNWQFKWKHIYLTYVTEQYIYYYKTIHGYFYYSIAGLKSLFNTISFSAEEYSLEFYDTSSNIINEDQSQQLYDLAFRDNSNVYMLGESGFIDTSDLSSDSLIINLYTYNQLLNTNYVASDFISDSNIIQYPDLDDLTITIKLYDSMLDDVVFQKEYNIAGLYIWDPSLGLQMFSTMDCYMSTEEFGNYLDIYYSNADVISLYLNDNYDDLQYTLEEFSQEGLYPDFDYSYSFYTLETGIRQMQTYITIISVVLMIIAFIMMTNLILSSVKQNKKEIGILRSLGYSAQNVYWIVLIESLILGIIVFIMLLLTQPLVVEVLNIIIAKQESDVIKFFSIEFYPLLIAFVIAILIPLIGSLFASIYISKLNPVDCIRSKE